MRRREFFKVIGGGAIAALPFPALAQQTERIRRIGVLMGFAEGDADTNVRIEGLRQGLGALGWSEGRNVRIDYRFAPAGARAQALAKELVALQPDVIVSHASPGHRRVAARDPHDSDRVRSRPPTQSARASLQAWPNRAVVQAAKFELIINLKTAKALGISVPPSMQARANEMIE